MIAKIILDGGWEFLFFCAFLWAIINIAQFLYHKIKDNGKKYVTYKYLDWLGAHHFDYRELINKGLAIEVGEENNSYKN